MELGSTELCLEEERYLEWAGTRVCVRGILKGKNSFGFTEDNSMDPAGTGCGVSQQEQLQL